MNRARRLIHVCVLALALFLGQQAAQLHDLAHAIQRVQTGSQDQHPGSDTCDKCSMYAPFSGAAASFVALVLPAPASILTAFSSFIPAQSRTVVSSRSRAPPSAV